MGALVRKPLKTSLLTVADTKAAPLLPRALTWVTRWVNRLGGAQVKWQHLPVPFEVYADGIDLVVFEEFGAGEAALHLKDELARNELMRDESYLAALSPRLAKRSTPRVWNRDFYDAHIVACPDALGGRSAVVRPGRRQAAGSTRSTPTSTWWWSNGARLRWRTTPANHRPDVLDRLAANLSVRRWVLPTRARTCATWPFTTRRFACSSACTSNT